MYQSTSDPGEEKKREKMELSSRMEGMFDLVDEVLKEIRDWRRELKELRLEIPIFEGRDVVGWVIRVEKYFEAGSVCKEEDQIPKIAQWMSGKAVTRYQLWISVNPSSTWGNFKDAILKKFGSEIDSIDNEEPNERPLPEWLVDQKPPLSKSPDISMAVFTDIPKIKSRNENILLPVSPLPQQPFTRGPLTASKFDPGEILHVSCTTQSFCFKLWDPGGYIFPTVYFFHLEDKVII